MNMAPHPGHGAALDGQISVTHHFDAEGCHRIRRL